MAQIQLSDVFGVSPKIPKHTYVDRNNLDDTFLYYLTTDRHIVIYGGSKQGKTILRKKHLREDAIVVNCRQGQVLEHIYLNILRQLKVHVDTQITNSLTQAGKLALEAEVDANLPFLGRLKATVSPEGGLEKSKQTTSEPIGVDPQHLEYIANEIRESRKRVVLEDFHYLSEQQQQRLAFDLKGFWDNSVFMIIIGIWEEDNLLTYYNGDLSGRVEEIDVEWLDEELRELLNKGSKVLNITFSEEIENELISDANGNVGLLQQLAEKLCFAERVTESTRSLGARAIVRQQALEEVRSRICSDLSAQYRKFYDAMKDGFEGNRTNTYGEIVRACTVAVGNDNLSRGIANNELLKAIQSNGGNISIEDLQIALSGLNRLQVEKNIYPMVLYYNLDMRKLQLADKQFLFYRHHCPPYWN